PEDDEDDVAGLDPGVGQYERRSEAIDHRRTSFTSCSTFAIGVSGKMPCPRLKICGRSAKLDRMLAVADSSASPPAIRASGSRLPWTGMSGGSAAAAQAGSTVSSI